MESKIDDRSTPIVILGLGYVGLPLGVEFARAGFDVTGVDPDAKKVKALREGRSYITDVRSEDVRPLIKSGKLKATADFSVIGRADVIFICVPTPFSKWKEPDLTYVIDASERILEHQQKGQLIVLESTTYPGTTEEVVLPILERNGLKGGRDFNLVFSPERVDPGNPTYSISNTPKVIGGMTRKGTRLAKRLYSKVIAEERVIEVSSPRIAEMTKLLENIFRSVNIALINELTLLCDRMKIDIWEVIDAAASKPFGFMPFYPSPGVGGHCIPVDPFYLSWKAREFDFYTKFIELSAEINLSMPRYVVQKVTEALNARGKSVKGSRILALGVTFKKNINDARNSPAIRVIEELVDRGAVVKYSDPYIPEIGNGARYFDIETHLPALRSVKLTAELMKRQDCALILVDHDAFDYEAVVRCAPLIVDTRNVTKTIKTGKKKIVKL